MIREFEPDNPALGGDCFEDSDLEFQFEDDDLTLGAGTIHPAAALFPPLSEKMQAQLAQSIRRNGLQHPIIVDARGRIIDGRHRYTFFNRTNSLTFAEIKKLKTAAGGPAIVRLKHLVTDADIMAYVLDSNLTRRHLTKNQQIEVHEKIRRLYGFVENGTNRFERREKVGCSNEQPTGTEGEQERSPFASGGAGTVAEVAAFTGLPESKVRRLDVEVKAQIAKEQEDQAPPPTTKKVRAKPAKKKGGGTRQFKPLSPEQEAAGWDYLHSADNREDVAARHRVGSRTTVMELARIVYHKEQAVAKLLAPHPDGRVPVIVPVAPDLLERLGELGRQEGVEETLSRIVSEYIAARTA